MDKHWDVISRADQPIDEEEMHLIIQAIEAAHDILKALPDREFIVKVIEK
jgi:hypothetical protein